jgi:prepilin-type N-terminal cleavage/methylation domain-containing protein
VNRILKHLKYGENGFTLIEVFLAVSLMSIGLVVMLTAVSRCLAVMKSAKNYQTAQWTLNKGDLDYPIVATNDVKSLVVSPVEYPGGFIFSREVDDDDDKDLLYVMRTKVSWSDHSREMSEEVVRYVLELPKE